MAYKRRLKNRKPPDGWERIEEVIEDFESQASTGDLAAGNWPSELAVLSAQPWAQMKEAVNEEHEGKRKNELTWKIHRIHWEKNRFIYDLKYVRKAISQELVRRWCLKDAAHKQHRPSTSPCAQYDYLVREKIADGSLISKWRKPGYELLCSMLAIQRGNHNFGTTSHCRSVTTGPAQLLPLRGLP